MVARQKKEKRCRTGSGRKPIRPIDRQKMRPWLVNLLEKEEVAGFQWINKVQQTFGVPWTHAARQGWTIDKDADLFERWARHTGKFIDGDDPDPKRWKANFRCALHSLPDVIELKKAGSRKGQNARRIYQFTDATVKVKQEKKKRSGRRLKRRYSYSSESSDEDTKDWFPCKEEPRDSESNVKVIDIKKEVKSEEPSECDSPIQAPPSPANSDSSVEFVESPQLPKFDQIWPGESKHFLTATKRSQKAFTGHTSGCFIPQPPPLQSWSSQTSTCDSPQSSSPQTPGGDSPRWGGSEGVAENNTLSDEEVIDLVTEMTVEEEFGLDRYNPRLWNSEIIIDGIAPVPDCSKVITIREDLLDNAWEFTGMTD